jgi:hypothetical protein
MTNIPAILIVGIFGILSLFSFYQYERNKVLSLEVQSYQAQITKLHDAAEQQAKDYNDAREEANQQMRQIQDNTQLILATVVPEDCDQAMQWGLNEAHTFG